MAVKSATDRRFVRKQLAVARTVVVNTRKHSIRRRHVARVFYAFKEHDTKVMIRLFEILRELGDEPP